MGDGHDDQEDGEGVRGEVAQGQEPVQANDEGQGQEATGPGGDVQAHEVEEDDEGREASDILRMARAMPTPTLKEFASAYCEVLGGPAGLAAEIGKLWKKAGKSPQVRASLAKLSVDLIKSLQDRTKEEEFAHLSDDDLKREMVEIMRVANGREHPNEFVREIKPLPKRKVGRPRKGSCPKEGGGAGNL